MIRSARVNGRGAQAQGPRPLTAARCCQAASVDRDRSCPNKRSADAGACLGRQRRSRMGGENAQTAYERHSISSTGPPGTTSSNTPTTRRSEKNAPVSKSDRWVSRSGPPSTGLWPCTTWREPKPRSTPLPYRFQRSVSRDCASRGKSGSTPAWT
jgi:hypothetical protein